MSILGDALIVGGGAAGLQAAIQLGRGGHRVVVVDAEEGRSTLCGAYHNVLGWPDGISGPELRRRGREHAGQYQVRFAKDWADRAEKLEPSGRDGMVFRIYGRSGESYEGKVLLVATGVMDRYPDLPGLTDCLGHSIYVCPDCDGYEIAGKQTVVLGAGDTGANMALTLAPRASELTYINHKGKPVTDKLQMRLKEMGVRCVEGILREIRRREDCTFSGAVLEDGTTIEGEKAFIAFGGNAVRTELLQQLGAERMESGHVVVDPRTKATSVPGVWAAGDIGVHAEQLAIAMGEGAQAAIWMHKALTAGALARV